MGGLARRTSLQQEVLAKSGSAGEDQDLRINEDFTFFQGFEGALMKFEIFAMTKHMLMYSTLGLVSDQNVRLPAHDNLYVVRRYSTDPIRNVTLSYYASIINA